MPDDAGAALSTSSSTTPRVRERFFSSIGRFLFGNDVFISYARADAATYALSLANALIKEGLTCFVDQYGTPPGRDIPPALRVALSRSTLLVLLASPAACQSRAVAEEITLFLRTGRPIIPVDFDGSIATAQWYEAVRGIALAKERTAALHDGKHAPPIVERITGTDGFVRRNVRLRRVFSAIVGALAAIVAVAATAAVVLTRRAEEARTEADRQRDEARRNREVALSRELAGNALASLEPDPQLSLGLALEAYSIAPSEGAASALRAWGAAPGIFSLRVGAAVRDAALSPDGTRLATVGEDGVVHVFDTATAKPIHELRGHVGRVWSVAFSHDGRSLVTGGEDRSVRLWGLAPDKPSHVLHGHDAANPQVARLTRAGVVMVRFSTDDRRVVSAGADGTARVWDAAVGGLAVRTLQANAFGVDSVAISADGAWVLTAGVGGVADWNVETGRRGQLNTVSADHLAVIDPTGTLVAVGGRSDGVAEILDISTGKPHARPLRGHTAAIARFAWSPSGAALATSSDDGSVRIWDAKTGLPTTTLAAPGALSLAFSRDGKMLATGLASGVVMLWDTSRDGSLLAALRGHTGKVWTAEFSTDDTVLHTSSADGTWRAWRTGVDRSARTLSGHEARLGPVLFRPDGRQVLTSAEDRTARTYGITGDTIVEMNTHATSRPAPVAYSPDSSTLATGGQDGHVRIWDGTRDKPIKDLAAHRGGIWDVVYAPDGASLVSAGEDGAARVWDASTSALRAVLVHPGAVLATAVSPDGRRVVTGGRDHKARLFVLEAREGGALSPDSGRTNADGAPTLEPAAVLDGHTDYITRVLFSRDGARIVTISLDGTVRTWDGVTGAPQRTFPTGNREGVLDASISPEGLHLAAATAAGEAWVWETATGVVLLRERTDTGWMMTASFNPDGRLLLTSGEDGNVRVWSISPGGLVASFHVVPARNRASWSPDGMSVVAASGDDLARVFACLLCAPPDALADLLRRKLVQPLGCYERRRFLHETTTCTDQHEP